MLQSFFEAVLPRTGQYAIFNLNSKQHVWADSIDKLVELVEARHAAQGIYFATASFATPTSRSQGNVQLLRAYRLDIDAGADKHERNPEGAYPSQREALGALVGFIKSTALTPSHIVSSGAGLHVYFALSEDVAPVAWLPSAKRLGELCAQHGLKADPAVTTDTARVLRPLGSLHKSGARVSLIKESSKRYTLDEFCKAVGTPQEAFSSGTRSFDMSINDDVLGSVQGPPKSAYKIAEKCPAMAEAAAAKGDVPEPYWRAMLGIVKHTVEGLDAAHEFSNGHPDYDEDATERKFNAYGAGPPTCAEFSRHSKACATCPHNGKIKSPIVLGSMTDQQVAELPPEKQPAEPQAPVASGMPWDGFIPARFDIVTGPGKGQRTLRYAMKVTKESDDGGTVTSTVDVPVTHDIFWLSTWSEAYDSKDSAKACVNTLVNGHVKAYMMEQKVVASVFDLTKWLADKGIQLSTDKKAGQAAMDYVKLGLQRIKEMGRQPKIAGRFGLRIEDGQLVCAHGKHVIYPDGRIEEALLEDSLAKVAAQYTVPVPDNGTWKWDKTVWSGIRTKAQKYVDFMKAHYGVEGLEKYQLVAMLGLASPFMAFVTGAYRSGIDLPKNGLSVSLYSRGSEKGKTALVEAIMLAYGNPSLLVSDSNATGATDIGRLAKLSVSGTFPTSMDEMGNTKEVSITNMISAVANGGGKTRGTKEGGFWTAQSWALINLITTNRSQRDMVKIGQEESAAIQYRLLELNVDDVYFSRDDRTEYRTAWAEARAETQGALGSLIHWAACRLGHDKLNAELVKCVEEADRLLQAQQGARFQYRALGAMLFLQRVLASLKLQMFETDTLIEQFKLAHASGVAYVAENVLPTGGVELLSMCLSDLKDRTLITETETHRGYRKGKNNAETYDVSVTGRVPDDVQARHVISHGWTYLSINALRKWCEEKKVSERELLNDCKTSKVLVPYDANRYSQQVDLFKGMREEKVVNTRAYKVNTRTLAALGGQVDQATLDNVIAFPGAEEPAKHEADEGAIKAGD